MTGQDCAVMCNLINTHTHAYTHAKCSVPSMGGITVINIE